MPKALVEINGITLLEYSIRKLLKYGFDDIIINVHHFGQIIIDFLKTKNNFAANISISDESDLLLDTGGGLKKAAWFFRGNESFLLYNCDIVSDINLTALYEYHLKNKGIATLAVRDRNSTRYLLMDDNRRLQGWWNVINGRRIIVNGKFEELNSMAFSGIHILDPEILNLLPSENVFSIIQFYLSIAGARSIFGFDHTFSRWHDVGKIKTIDDLREIDLNELF
jgi:NDP-sugar pyrophosphorylase family protein